MNLLFVFFSLLFFGCCWLLFVLFVFNIISILLSLVRLRFTPCRIFHTYILHTIWSGVQCTCWINIRVWKERAIHVIMVCRSQLTCCLISVSVCRLFFLIVEIYVIVRIIILLRELHMRILETHLKCHGVAGTAAATTTGVSRIWFFEISFHPLLQQSTSSSSSSPHSIRNNCLVSMFIA